MDIWRRIFAEKFLIIFTVCVRTHRGGDPLNLERCRQQWGRRSKVTEDILYGWPLLLLSLLILATILCNLLEYFRLTNNQIIVQIHQQKHQKKIRNMLKKHQSDVNDLILVFLLLCLNVFHTFFSISIADFEQVNVSWVKMSSLSFNQHACL